MIEPLGGDLDVSQSQPGSRKASQPGITKQVRVLLLLALLTAAVAGVLTVWNARLAAPLERLMHVYRTHGCR